MALACQLTLPDPMPPTRGTHSSPRRSSLPIDQTTRLIVCPLMTPTHSPSAMYASRYSAAIRPKVSGLPSRVSSTRASFSR